MSQIRWLVAVVGVLASTIGGVLLACGDKWLVPSRAVRYELPPAARERARLLIYANPASPMPSLMERLSVDPALRKAGYRPTSVATRGELDRTLRQSHWDVLLVDLADGLGVGDVARSPGAPAVVAVAPSPTSIELAEAKKHSVSVLKAPTRSRAFVEVIDLALINRQVAQERAEKAAR
jgi:hypothetical protein